MTIEETKKVFMLAALSDYFGTTITDAVKSNVVGVVTIFSRSLHITDEFNQESDVLVTFVATNDGENQSLKVTNVSHLDESNSRPSVAYLREQLAKAEAIESGFSL